MFIVSGLIGLAGWFLAGGAVVGTGRIVTDIIKKRSVR